ncbi:MAG: amino acid permease [Acidobacteria bacterium]|nr:amino acid permease [Acidobacteriota bacterium]
MSAQSELAVAAPETRLIRGLGLFDSTMIIAGSMIGSGIFIVSADIARTVGHPLLLLTVWSVAGVMTVLAALSYGELAAAMPNAGGQYVYIREAFSPLFGFLYGWTLFAVIQTGTIAAVAVAFGKFLGVFWPWVSAGNVLFRIPLGFTWIPFSSQILVGVAVTVLLTWVNTQGLRVGATVQNIFTVCKIGSLLAVAMVGIFLGKVVSPIVASAPIHWDLNLAGLFGAAMVGPLFSMDAWNNITFTAGEVAHPKRNLPLSLALGTMLVISLYVMTNISYLHTLTLEQIAQAPEDRVAAYAFQILFGPWGRLLISGAIMISTFGCLNGLILSGARVYYAMAHDGLFFARAARVEPRHHTPRFSLWIQALWTCLLTMSGTYSQLLDYVIFAALLFYALTMAGIFRLRRIRPQMERPYRALGYPLLTTLYIVAAAGVMLSLLIYKPSFSLRGLLIVLTGVPVYFLWRRHGSVRDFSASD